jgi:ABC-type glycerol-3-phosphate transport system substrate-binding protein
MQLKVCVRHLFVFGLIILAGCQTTNSSESRTLVPTVNPTANETGISSTPTQVVEESTEEAEISRSGFTLWHPFSGLEAGVIDELVAQYNAPLEDAMKVVAVSHADDEIFIADIFQSIAEGSEPDLIIAPSYLIQSLASEMVIEPIQLNLPANNQNDFGVTFFPVFWNLDLVDGERYGIPYIQNGHFLFYNSTWSQALGFPYTPTTVAEFSEQTCAAFNQNRFDESFDNDGTGGYFYPGDPIALMSWLRAFGGGIDVNNRGEVILTTEENIEALSFLRQMYVDDCAWWTDKEIRPYRYLANRNALAFSGQTDEIQRQQDSISENQTLDSWQLIAYPSNEGKPVVYFESYSFSIMQGEDEKSESMLPFIEWMLAPEQHLDMVYLNGAFPLTAEEIQEADRSWELFPIWQGALPYIPFLEPIPQTENWYYLEKVLDDLRWQIIQFAVNEADIPGYLTEAEALVNNLSLAIAEE